MLKEAVPQNPRGGEIIVHFMSFSLLPSSFHFSLKRPMKVWENNLCSGSSYWLSFWTFQPHLMVFENLFFHIFYLKKKEKEKYKYLNQIQIIGEKHCILKKTELANMLYILIDNVTHLQMCLKWCSALFMNCSHLKSTLNLNELWLL